METTRSHRRRVAFYALITLLLTLVPGTVYARAMAPLDQASLRLAPPSAPLDPNTPFYRGANDAGSIWQLKAGEITAIQRGRTNTGVSVFNQAGLDAGSLNRFPCVYKLLQGTVPATLRVQQRGLNPNHFEIMPNARTTVGAYSQELAHIPLVLVHGIGNPIC
jgi:hypothetical protein